MQLSQKVDLSLACESIGATFAGNEYPIEDDLVMSRVYAFLREYSLIRIREG